MSFLGEFLTDPEVYGVARMGDTNLVSRPYIFERAVQLILRATQSYFEDAYRETGDIAEVLPLTQNGDSGETLPLLRTIENRAAKEFYEYLDRFFVSADKNLYHGLSTEELFCQMLELRTGLTRHLLARALHPIWSRIHDSDQATLDPLLNQIRLALDVGAVDFDTCRLVLEIRQLREIKRPDDVMVVVFVVRRKPVGTAMEPIVVTVPFRQQAHLQQARGAEGDLP